MYMFPSQYRVLHSSLTKQASDWVQARKEDQARDDFSRWMNVSGHTQMEQSLGDA